MCKFLCGPDFSAHLDKQLDVLLLDTTVRLYLVLKEVTKLSSKVVTFHFVTSHSY